jgi:hypothetical protein
VLVVGDQSRFEAALEQMADAAVASVEGRGVQPVQPLHPLRQRRLPALDDQMEVVAHQAVGVQLPGAAVGDAKQELDEEPPIVVVHEDRAPVDATRGQVVDAVGKGRTPWTRHDSNLGSTVTEIGTCGRIVTLLLRSTRPFRPCPGPAPGHDHREHV